MGLPEFVCHPSCTFFLEGGSLLLTPSYFGCPGVFQPALQQHRCYYGYFHIFIFHPGLQWSSFPPCNFQNKSPKNSMFSRPFTAVCKDAGLQPLGAAWLDFPRGNRIVVEAGGNTLTQERSRISQIRWRVFTEFVPFCEVTNNRNNLHQPPKTQSNSLQMHTFPPLPSLRGYSQETSSHKFKFA